MVPASLDIAGNFFSDVDRVARDLIAKAVTWASPPPVSLEGPRALSLTVNRQPAENRLVAHLLNIGIYIWSAGESVPQGCRSPISLDSLDFAIDREVPAYMWNKTDYKRRADRSDFPNREMYELAMRARRRTDRYANFEIDQYLPVFDLILRIDPKVYPVKKAWLYPDKNPLQIRPMKGKIEIRVPRVDIHAAVAMELSSR